MKLTTWATELYDPCITSSTLHIQFHQFTYSINRHITRGARADQRRRFSLTSECCCEGALFAT